MLFLGIILPIQEVLFSTEVIVKLNLMISYLMAMRLKTEVEALKTGGQWESIETVLSIIK